ncbi:MAG: oxidoreductase [Alphaproteobacteria bacterium]|nr:MAG: oxidoreductase [Alphaproteobacteria bacterium]
MTILLAGATGLIGSRVLALLPDAVPVGRRPTGRAGEVVADFIALPALPPASVAICALGTTIRAAGSEAAFRAVDFDAVLAFARAAQAAGVTQFILVTAVGADATSRVFYSRVKGEVEAAVAALGFARLDLIQPGLILGPRADRRPVEAILQRVTPWLNPLLVGGLDKYGAIDAGVVAAAIVALIDADAPGRFVHQNRAMRRLAA